ncbi:MAG: choice-of-anchor tandem repeat GloVer-containing protein, partial [bacterium]
MATLRRIGCVLLFGAAITAGNFASAADGYRVLHNFNGGDGSFPSGNLVLDDAGNLYGTTPLGGTFGNGAVFKLNSSGRFTLSYSFTGGNDGGDPEAGLAIDPATGDLYGTTTQGGRLGHGGIFRLTPGGDLAVLHDFNGDSDGIIPLAALMRDRVGDFFGTTNQDGPAGGGTVFELASDGTFRVLHALAGGDGGEPMGRLARNGSDLYG